MTAAAKKVVRKTGPSLGARLPAAGLIRRDFPWYVAIAHPNSEAIAEIEIRRQGFEAWVPVCLAEVNHAREGRIKMIRPLFPRYLFVGVDPRAGLTTSAIMSPR